VVLSRLVTAPQAGIEHCDILDRERLRIELDSPAGFFVRFQHLGIPLSEAEQASFLARYGDRIQQVVTVGLSDNRADPSKSRAGGPAYRALPTVSGGIVERRTLSGVRPRADGGARNAGKKLTHHDPPRLGSRSRFGSGEFVSADP
jgi:hypothetical protein